MWGRCLVLAFGALCFAPACDSEREPVADAGALCFQDYFLFQLGVNDEAAGFTVLEDGAELRVEPSPLPIQEWTVTFATRVRVPGDPAETAVRVDLLIDSTRIKEWASTANYFDESPLGLEREIELTFFEDPAAYYGMSGHLWGDISDLCGRSSTVETSIVLTGPP